MTPRRPGALIIGGNYGALGIVRSLGRHRIPVWVLSDGHHVAATSRYSQRNLPWPDVQESSQVDYLLGLALANGLDGWTIFPTTDESAAALARHHAPLSERFRLTISPWEVMRRAHDKRLTYRLAAGSGIDVPRTWYPRNADEVAALDITFPVIIKPAVKQGSNRLTDAKAWRVDDRRSLLNLYADACTLVDPSIIMVQEIIPGDGYSQFSYAAVCEHGHPLSWLVARRSRQYPREFGRFSTFVEVIDLPPVADLSRRLLETIPLTGLVEIEVKRDDRNGPYKLLDVNGRVWGWHTLGRAVGLDFPYLLYRLMHGERVEAVATRQEGRWVRMATDIPAAMVDIRRGTLRPMAYARSLRRPIELAMYARDDPVPALLELPLAIQHMWKRRSTP